ncbi:MAG: gamma-glutamyltransferase [Gemmataceae bacterium]
MRAMMLLGLLLPLAAATEVPRGIVVSVSPAASHVGQQTLARGGNAVDAAVAVGFALAVTWPEAGNIGGGGFMLVRPAGRIAEPVVFDYRETAPAAASADLFVKRRQTPHLTVGVPGSVAGLARAHQKFGKLPWRDVVAPAVALAEKGFAIDRSLAASLNRELASKKLSTEFRRVFGKPGGKWQAGDRLVQPDLARTLRRIAEKGAAGFYQGETADLLVKEMKAGDGLITHADLTAYRAVERAPIHATYRGYDVYGPPPPSSGGITLTLMLNMLEPFDLPRRDPAAAETVHLLAEVMRRAYAERALYLGDADFVKIPPHLTTKEHARKLAATIDPKRATASETLAPDLAISDGGAQTTHYSVLDADGMAVSTTTTLEDSFGSRVVVRGGGFLLNNEMTDFNPRPGVTTRTGQIGTPANQIAPGKRMLSSMTPTIVVRDGKVILVTGSPGGRTIINTVLCVVTNVLDHGLTLRQAVDAPRLHQQWFPDRLQVEARLVETHPGLRQALEARGHRLHIVPRQGDAHSIGFDAKAGVYRGEMDHRIARPR